MIRTAPAALAACVVWLLASAPNDACAFLDIFKKPEEKRAYTADELASQQSKAEALLAKARTLEAEGKRRQARDIYKTVSRSYPLTESGAEAKFAYALLLEAEGDGRKAFEEYEELIANHRNTPNFNEAVKRQFDIAEGLRNSKKKGFLGIGAAVQPSKLVEMFESISDSAPFTDWAPKSLLNVGYVRHSIGETEPSIAAFQKVVDKYPGTEFAKEAQFQIFKLRGVTAEKSNSPVKDRAQVEAGLDFVNQNPEDQRAMEVKNDMQLIEERSIKKLFETGQFYEKSNKPESARVYYREVVKNPNTPWAAQAQERLNALDGVSVEKKASLFGSSPLKRDKPEMRTTADEVVPLPAP